MATKKNTIPISIASALYSILFIQTAIQGSSMYALGQVAVVGKYGQITEQNHQYLPIEQDTSIQNPTKSIALAAQNISTTPLTQIFKQVENSVVQITSICKTPYTYNDFKFG